MKLILLFLSLLSFLTPALAELKPFVVPGFESRTAQIDIPSQYTPAQQWPLILSLHGYGSNGVQQAAYLGIASRVSRDGYILVTPDGSRDSTGKMFWNAWSSCCNRDGADINDVGFLDAVLQTVAQNYAIDPARIYFIGHSNGAFMAYRFVCERPSLVAAVFGLAGTMGPEACRNSGPTHIVHMHGTADATIRYEGGSVLPTAPRYAGALETAGEWAGLNACNATPTDASPLDLLTGLGFEGPETRVQKWVGCRNSSSVELWSMNNAPHIPNIFVPERLFTKAVLQKALSLRLPAH